MEASVGSWLGAMVSHVLQLYLFLAMSAVIPGQKKEVCALPVIWLTPWWAPCRWSSTSFLNDSGMTIRSPIMITPSSTVRLCLCRQ